jgi:hypothetical protein
MWRSSKGSQWALEVAWCSRGCRSSLGFVLPLAWLGVRAVAAMGHGTMSRYLRRKAGRAAVVGVGAAGCRGVRARCAGQQQGTKGIPPSRGA